MSFRELIVRILSVLRENIEYLSMINKESVLQDFLAFKLKDILPNIERRKRIFIPSYPIIEIDLVDLKQNVAIEVKLNPFRFYDGIQQALVLRDIYGFKSVLIQVYDKADKRVVNALRIIAIKYSLPVIIIEKCSKGVIWLGIRCVDSL